MMTDVQLPAPWSEEDFEDWLYWIFQDSEDYAMGVVSAYFDETRKDGKFGVAGCMFTRLGATKFAHAWKRLFGSYGGCHMSELVHRRGRFEGIGSDERDRLVKGAVQTIGEHVALAQFVCCELKDIEEYLDHYRAPWLAYAHCAKMAMVGMVVKCEQDMPNKRIRYTFESGYENQGEFAKILAELSKRQELHKSWLYAEHAFSPKDANLWLQAADVFAWESVKAKAESIDSDKRPLRKSFQALAETLEYNDRFRFTVIGRSVLYQSFDWMLQDPKAYWLRLD
jgi:hypothetical protein